MKKFIIVLFTMLVITPIFAECEWTDIEDSNSYDTWLVECENGMIAEIDYFDDVPEYATIYQNNGAIYEGQVNSDIKPHGYGGYSFDNGDKQSGSYRKGRAHGTMKYTWANGSWERSEYKYGKQVKVLGSYNSAVVKRNNEVNAYNKKQCRKAKDIITSAQTGTQTNILIYALTGGSSSNQRSFENNISNANQARRYLKDNNCARFGIY